MKIGSILTVLFAMSIMVHTVQATSASVQILEGVVLGLGFDMDIEECARDLRDVTGDFSNGFRNLEVHKKSYIERGAKDIGYGLLAMKEALEDCGASGLVDQVEDLAMGMIAGEGILKDGWELLVHGKDIYDDVKAAHNYYERREWRGLGEELGRIARYFV